MKRILIVEDELDIREILKMFLEDEGYEIVIAVDANKGFEVILQNKTDLIISDIMMPGMSGIDLLNKVKSTPEIHDIPFILMSAADLQLEKIGVKKHSTFIKKPFDIDKLLPLIAEHLKQTKT